jgi:hypothetical protein
MIKSNDQQLQSQHGSLMHEAMHPWWYNESKCTAEQTLHPSTYMCLLCGFWIGMWGMGGVPGIGQGGGHLSCMPGCRRDHTSAWMLLPLLPYGKHWLQLHQAWPTRAAKVCGYCCSAPAPSRELRLCKFGTDSE